MKPGENAPAPAGPWRVEVVTTTPVDVVALVTDGARRVRSDADVVFFNNPVGRGVGWQSSAPQLVVDPAVVDPAADAVVVTVCTDGGGPWADEPRVTVTGSDGATLDVPLVGLGVLTGVVALELYRRGGQWKVRAVVQGWAGGLAAVLTGHGVDVDPEPVAAQPAAPAADPTPAGDPEAAPARLSSRAGRGLTPPPATPPSAPAAAAPPVGAGPVDGAPRREPTPDYRGVLRAIFEESSRAVVAYRDTTGFALDRRERQTSELMARGDAGSPAYLDARRALQASADELLAEGRRRLDIAVTLVTDELLGLEPPAAAAPWTSPAWSTWQPGEEVEGAVLVGRLGVEENEGLLLPLTVTPFGGPAMWHAVDETVDEGALTAAAHAHVVRLVAALAPTNPRVAVLDPAGRGFPSLGPNARHVVRDVEVRELLAEASRVVALGDAPDRPIVLVVVAHPEGLDELQALQLSGVLRDGLRVGILCVLTASPTHDPVESAGALVARQESLHLPVGPGATVTDVWVSTEWSFTPEGPPPPHVVEKVLAHVGEP